MELEHLLRYAVERGASDLHLKNGCSPMIRVHGQLQTLAENLPVLTPEYMERLSEKIMDARQVQIFQDDREVDIAYSIRGLGRFRVNVFKQRGSISMVIRSISKDIPSIRQLRLPLIIEKVSSMERGLVLVTGITGAGKSTTMASILSHINNNYSKHIVTIEDPIEYLLRDNKSIVSQREIGSDTMSFSKALRASLRQDPDVILIGEMRDKDTIETALMAAETGHLVISTLHTKDAKESINRILSFFEPSQHGHIRSLLASNLRAVVSQRLARNIENTNFVPVVEVLINNERISDMILDPNKTNGIREALEESNVGFGMQSFEQHLSQLVKQKIITMDEALRHASNQDDFQLRMKGIQMKGEQDWAAYHDDGTATQASGAAAWESIPALEIDNPFEKPVEEENKKQQNKYNLDRFRKKKP